MKTTGIVRKIDELGRIVLPKELRKCLNINTGDDFQIRVEDEKIILEKYSYLKNYEQEILKIINCFISETTYDISLVVNGKIINKNNEIIDQKLDRQIQERKILECKNIEELELNKNLIIEGRYIILPIVVNSDLLGSLIIVSKDDIIRMEKTSKLLLKLIKSKFE